MAVSYLIIDFSLCGYVFININPLYIINHIIFNTEDSINKIMRGKCLSNFFSKADIRDEVILQCFLELASLDDISIEA